MNKTANFQLTQWEKTDRIMMEDFNRDNAAIDTALKSSGPANGAGQLRKLQDRIRLVHRDRQIRQRKSQQADL